MSASECLIFFGRVDIAKDVWREPRAHPFGLRYEPRGKKREKPVKFVVAGPQSVLNDLSCRASIYRAERLVVSFRLRHNGAFVASRRYLQQPAQEFCRHKRH